MARVFFALGVSATMANAQTAPQNSFDDSSDILSAACRELLIGMLIAWAFQAAYSALYTAGRTLDIQAGHGFAMILDPTSHASSPLTGNLFSLAAGISFFLSDGHLQLVRLLSNSFLVAPLGALAFAVPLTDILGVLSEFLVFGFGFAAAPLLALFLTDCIIALLARTTPQINPLILGIQIKSTLLVLLLPLTFSGASAVFASFNALILHSLTKSFGN